MKRSLPVYFLLLFFCMSGKTDPKKPASFIEVRGNQFYKNNKPYTFLGTNFWYGMNLGSKGSGGNRQRLIRELDRLSALGVKNLRVVAGSEGPDNEPYRMLPSLQTAPGKYNNDVLEGLDFLLAEMSKREMVAVMCMNDFWNWSGGMAQYLVWAGAANSIPYSPPNPGGDWWTFQNFSAQFYSNPKSVEMFNNHLRFMVNRRNSITGKLYKEDPTIFSWELGNEPRGVANQVAFLEWVDQTAGLIKSFDKNHLVTTGSEGNTSSPTSGTNVLKDHLSKNIDYATIHIWVQNWGFYDPKKPDATYQPALDYALNYLQEHLKQAAALHKPVVLEEFGISRDGNNHAEGTPVTVRDKYYGALFAAVADQLKKQNNALAGVNFWAWAGEGRPRVPEGLWKLGDNFIGDPPHESQGWYSVYDTDNSTKQVIKKYASLINQ
jgi:mannan endo-1,4-beta-mannosidase